MSTTSPATVAPEAPSAPAAVVPVQPSLPLAPAPQVPPALAAMLTPPPASQDAPRAPAEPAKAAEAPKAQRDAEARLAALESELASARASARAATVRELVTRTAAEAHAINPEQVHVLVRDLFDVTDDGRVIVKSDPRADARGEIARFLASNLHLLRPALTGGGAGSPAAVVAPTSAQSHPAHSREGGTAIAHRALASLLGTAPGTPAATAPTAPKA